MVFIVSFFKLPGAAVHFCPIACQPRKGMTSGDTVTFPRMAEDQLEMEPENTSLDKENQNIFQNYHFQVLL